jgi:hypothetical protein
MKSGKQTKALILLTLFIGVIGITFASQLLSPKSLNHKQDNVEIVEGIEDSAHDWLVRVADAEKEPLSQRVLEYFHDDFVRDFHSSLDIVQLLSFTSVIKLHEADTKLFLDNCQFLI